MWTETTQSRTRGCSLSRSARPSRRSLRGGSGPPPQPVGASLLRHVVGLSEERVVGRREGGRRGGCSIACANFSRSRISTRRGLLVGAQVAQRVTPPRFRFELTHRVQPAEHQWFPSLTIVSIGTHSLHVLFCTPCTGSSSSRARTSCKLKCRNQVSTFRFDLTLPFIELSSPVLPLSLSPPPLLPVSSF